MRELLRDAPVKILEVRPRDDVRRCHRSCLETRLKLDVVGEIVRRTQIRQRLWILWRQRFPKWSERLQGNDPW